jgi:diguanylate cyclase (GGDEF)-like protein
MPAEPENTSDWQSRFVAELPAAVALFDPDRRYRAASSAWITAFGLSRVALSGHRHDELCRAGRQALEEVQRRALLGEAVDDYQVVEDDATRRSWTILNARPHRALDGTIAGAIVTLRQTHLPGVAELEHPAPDALTGIAERGEFVARLREILGDPDPASRAVAVITVNIDNFRHINTLYGSAIGDQVLRVTAERLVSGTRSTLSGGARGPERGTDMVARLGADEFAIIGGAPAPRLAEVETVASRLLQAVQSPIAADGRSLRLTASAGFITTTPAHRHEDDVLRDLDLALQQAKALGPSRLIAWKPAITAAATRRYLLADQLRRAFDDGEFVLHYQPIVRLSDGQMVGAEALLRWNHPSDGLVASAAIIPVLEEIGLIVEVGNRVIREVVRQLETWHVVYGRDVIDWVGVNLSARQLNDPAQLLAILGAIHDSGFAMRRLKLEMTETSLMRGPAIAGPVFDEMQKLGLRFAIDDFGTGYSALNSLRRYPVDTIKIDGEFTAQIGTTEGDKLFQALLSIAQIFGAAVVAQGIETAAQRDFLQQSGCSFGQGYLLAEPMDGALLGAYALTHAVGESREPARSRRAG